ncbi:hypothetical protein [uncultured Sphingomonas sp.]|uniref:hypothetical protein n=1 Tax=uncultured Sphingomonas sp. TaxID=158754 RepID=UPI002633FC9B|nr:hypothetical protein [uncultured Sphingomonas sp.]
MSFAERLFGEVAIMTLARSLTFVALAIGLATPGLAQIYGPYASNRIRGSSSVQDYRRNIADYKRLVAKKRREDGGSLTFHDQDMLDRRLKQIVSEETVKRHPLWSTDRVDAFDAKLIASHPNWTN